MKLKDKKHNTNNYYRLEEIEKKEKNMFSDPKEQYDYETSLDHIKYNECRKSVWFNRFKSLATDSYVTHLIPRKNYYIDVNGYKSAKVTSLMIDLHEDIVYFLLSFEYYQEGKLTDKKYMEMCRNNPEKIQDYIDRERENFIPAVSMCFLHEISNIEAEELFNNKFSKPKTKVKKFKPLKINEETRSKVQEILKGQLDWL